MEIPKHKVFISYYHKDDQSYKDWLLQANYYHKLFDDYSVHEDEIDDIGLSSEQIRCKIRDEYIKDATVLILLCGQNTKKRKHIDWEIHAAMYDSPVNPKMGILVINLPSVSSRQGMISNSEKEKNIMGPYINWTPLNKEENSLKEKYPFLPNRIIKNLLKDGVKIPVVNWDVIANNTDKLKELIDIVYINRTTNNYDHSDPLRSNNS